MICILTCFWSIIEILARLSNESGAKEDDLTIKKDENAHHT